jgi:hypothetical protein
VSRRTERVGEQIRAELARLLREEVADPRIGLVTLTRVDLAPDFGNARVFWSSLPRAGASEEESARELERTEAGLLHAASCAGASAGSRSGAPPSCTSGTLPRWPSAAKRSACCGRSGMTKGARHRRTAVSGFWWWTSRAETSHDVVDAARRAPARAASGTSTSTSRHGRVALAVRDATKPCPTSRATEGVRADRAQRRDGHLRRRGRGESARGPLPSEEEARRPLRVPRRIDCR